MGNAKVKAKKSNTNKWAALGVAAIAFIFICCVILSVVVDTGIVDRSRVVMSSDNFKVTGSMIKYFYNSQVNTFYSNYGSYASYFGLDFSKPLDQQDCGWTEEKGDTWHDYFLDMTAAEIKQYMVYCEAALKAGVKLDKEDQATIDESMASIETVANAYGYSLNGYITAMYGSGIKAKDVRECFELIQLYAKYAEIKYEEIEDGVTESDVNKQFEDYITKYLVADYISFTWTATSKVSSIKEADYSTKEEYEAAKKKAEDAYKELKEKYDAYAEDLKSATTLDEFKEKLKKILLDEEYDGLLKSDFDKDLEDYKKKNPDKSEEDAKKAVEEALMKEAEENVEDAMEKALMEDSAYTITTDLGKWIFGTEVKDKVVDEEETEDDKKDEEKEDEEPVPAAKENDIFVDKSTEKEEKDSGKYVVTVAFLIKEAARDDSPTHNVGHILIKPSYSSNATTQEKEEASETARKKAQEILDKYLAGELTKEAFEELAKEHTEDSGVFYDGVKDGEMVEEFNNWLFSLGDYEGVERKVGDTGLVETSYGWHVMYYNGQGNEKWYENAENDYISNVLADWYEATEKEVGVKTNDGLMSKVAF